MGQGEAMEVLKGGSSMLLPRIDGGCHPLDASQGSGSQNPGDPRVYVFFTLYSAKRKETCPNQNPPLGCIITTLASVSVAYGSGLLAVTALSYENPSLPELTMEEHPGWCEHGRWLEVGVGCS